jgi:adenine-specific DNA-methyltransferase
MTTNIKTIDTPKPKKKLILVDKLTTPASKKSLGQYFTICDTLQQFVFDKVKYKGSTLLESSFGAGHLLKKFKALNTNYPMVLYELDKSIKSTIEFNQYQKVIYGDFTKQNIDKKFKTIIGNPPYVKKSTGNLYIKFIEICYELLEDDGEMVFIVPSDFIKLTSASSIISKMTNNGSFTDFLFPHDEKLFENASIDVLVFRYQKGVISNKTIVNGNEMYCNVNNGIITFSDSKIVGKQLSDLFNVYVGIVSGRDEIYRVPFGNIDVLNDMGRVQKYIYTDVYPTKDTKINEHLENNKEKLLERKIKKFTELNWYQWGAPRNMKSIQKNMGKDCIYVRNMTRNKDVAFIDKVQYFGGGLLCLMPKQSISNDKLKIVLEFLNSTEFQKDYLYSGRFKIGHKQVSNVIIPNQNINHQHLHRQTFVC